jgi:hypothetical protein
LKSGKNIDVEMKDSDDAGAERKAVLYEALQKLQEGVLGDRMIQHSFKELRTPMPEVIAKDEFVKNMKHIIHHGIRNMNMKSNMAAVLPEYYPGADPAEAVGLLMPLNFEMSQLHSHN